MGITHTNSGTADAPTATYAHEMGLSGLLGCLDSLQPKGLTSEASIGLELGSKSHPTPTYRLPPHPCHQIGRAARQESRW